MGPELKQQGTLPLLVVSPVDVGRLMRELDALDEHYEARKLRGKTGPDDTLKVSKLLGATAEMNSVHLHTSTGRHNLLQFLKAARSQAPVLHISFNADPTPAFVQKLMEWLRREIHPVVLLTIGLQPNLGAGCILRTTNKYFDLSLRKHFMKSSELLTKAMKELE